MAVGPNGRDKIYNSTERELTLGDSMSAFMRELCLVPTGCRWSSITRLKNRTNRLFAATVHCRYDTSEQATILNLGLVESNQFGASYQPNAQGLRDFKKKFFKHMQKVHVLYPEADVSEGDNGLILKPSKPHVKRIKK